MFSQWWGFSLRVSRGNIRSCWGRWSRSGMNGKHREWCTPCLSSALASASTCPSPTASRNTHTHTQAVNMHLHSLTVQIAGCNLSTYSNCTFTPLSTSSSFINNYHNISFVLKFHYLLVRSLFSADKLVFISTILFPLKALFLSPPTLKWDLDSECMLNNSSS